MTNPDRVTPTVSSADLITTLQNVIRTNYSLAAAHQATVGETFQTVADAVCKAHPAVWLAHAAADLPVGELADAIAASLSIRLRKLSYGSTEYAAVNAVRMHMHAVRAATAG